MIDWEPTQTSQPPRSGYWYVTREGGIETCLYQHPDHAFYYIDGKAVEPGWYDLSEELVEDVEAWAPLPKPYRADRKPERQREARLGETIGSVRIEQNGRTLLHLRIEGGDRVEDDLIMGDVRRAIDTLFDALYPRDMGDGIETRLYP